MEKLSSIFREKERLILNKIFLVLGLCLALILPALTVMPSETYAAYTNTGTTNVSVYGIIPLPAGVDEISVNSYSFYGVGSMVSHSFINFLQASTTRNNTNFQDSRSWI